MAYKKAKHILGYLLILTAIFMILQVSALLAASPILKRMLSTSYIPNLMPHWWQLGPLVSFIVIEVVLYGLLTVAIWLVACFNALFWEWRDNLTLYSALVLWALTIVVILLLNQVCFPLSTLAMLMSTVVPEKWSYIALYPLITILIGFGVSAWLGLWVCLKRRGKIWALAWGGVTLVLIIASGVAYHWNWFITPKHPHRGSTQKPNIILIGIDSLRPDYTGLSAKPPITRQSLTPHLDQFLKDGTVFTQASTPLARTFPSWTTVLTGQYPNHNGVRFDLYPQNQLNLAGVLPKRLKQQGYTTYFATDEKRFSHIGHHFGIEHALGPKTGFFDFFIGSINDFPLSNLLLNTSLGRWLFPYTAINRSDFITYKPSAFNAYIERKLIQAPQNKPVFLAVHFCLPHWPYIWRDAHLNDLHEQFPRQLYKRSVKRVDTQLAQFVEFLKQHHYLDHSVVIVLSDHGEALLKPNDRIVHYKHYEPGPASSPDIMHTLDNLFNFKGYHFNTSYGHGTDVLSLVQNHIVLGIKTQGIDNPSTYAGKINQPVSTIDIKPTILDLLGWKNQVSLDGRSLVPYLQNKRTQAFKRPLFLETGLVPPELKRNGKGLPSTLSDILHDYELHADTMLSLTPQAARHLIPFKQRAVRQGNWLLALYPLHLPNQATILVNTKSGRWTDDLHSQWAQQAPVKKLLNQLRQLYGQEVTQNQPF